MTINSWTPDLRVDTERIDDDVDGPSREHRPLKRSIIRPLSPSSLSRGRGLVWSSVAETQEERGR